MSGFKRITHLHTTLSLVLTLHSTNFRRRGDWHFFLVCRSCYFCSITWLFMVVIWNCYISKITINISSTMALLLDLRNTSIPTMMSLNLHYNLFYLLLCLGASSSTWCIRLRSWLTSCSQHFIGLIFFRNIRLHQVFLEALYSSQFGWHTQGN